MLRFDSASTTSTSATLVHARDTIWIERESQSVTNSTDPTAVTQRFYRVTLNRQSVSTCDITPISPPVIHWRTPKEENDAEALRSAMSLDAVHSRVPKKALVLRASYQQMARLPCYCGRRAR